MSLKMLRDNNYQRCFFQGFVFLCFPHFPPNNRFLDFFIPAHGQDTMSTFCTSYNILNIGYKNYRHSLHDNCLSRDSQLQKQLFSEGLSRSKLRNSKRIVNVKINSQKEGFGKPIKFDKLRLKQPKRIT